MAELSELANLQQNEVEEDVFPYWSTKLANEICRKVVSYLDIKDRASLRQCSQKDKELVESIPVRMSPLVNVDFQHDHNLGDRITIVLEGGKRRKNWRLETIDRELANERFQAKMGELDYVKEMNMRIHAHNIELFPNYTGEKYLNVQSFEIENHMDLPSVIKHIKKINPRLLKTLKIRTILIDPSEELFSLPQVLNAERLFLNFTPIVDEQLVRLNASQLIIYTALRLTTSGVLDFAQVMMQRPISQKTVFFEIRYTFKKAELAKAIMEKFEVLREIREDEKIAFFVRPKVPNNDLIMLVTFSRHVIQGERLEQVGEWYNHRIQRKHLTLDDISGDLNVF